MLLISGLLGIGKNGVFMKFSTIYALILIAIGITFPKEFLAQDLLKGDFWKQQSLEKIIKPWHKHVFDDQDGGYHAYLKRDWQAYQFSKQYPGMISRQLFSFSAAYLLSGNPKYLLSAHETFDYLVEKGWDEKYGGWYQKLDDQGYVEDKKKDLFMQTYAISGLSMYYIVTRNSRAKEYIDKSYQILKQYAWDKKHKGYYRQLNRDLSVAKTVKDFSPQVAPATGFLTYLYPITRDTQYLRQMDTIMDLCWNKMRHPQHPWIMERFSRDWRLTGSKNDKMNVGHNLEVVWQSLRVYNINDDENFKENATGLAQKLNKKVYYEKTGAWYHKMSPGNATDRSPTTTWWVQAYGNLTQLYLYHITKEDRYLERFQKGAKFWNDAFIDNKYGGSVLKADLSGSISEGDKAVKTKTAYHAMEHGLLNYLYTNLFVQKEPVHLYYNLSYTEEGEAFYPSFLAEFDIQIQSVKVNREPWEKFEPDKAKINLPETKSAKIEVTLE